MRQAWRAWVAAGLLGCAGLAGAAEPPGLWPTLQMLQGKRFVDLTHAFNPGIPHWPGFDPETRTTTYSYTPGGGSKGAGFFAQTYTLPGQWGTHVDPPAHFIEGKRTVDQIDVREMVLPLHKSWYANWSVKGPHSIHLCGDATRHYPIIRDECNVYSFDTGFPVDHGRLRKTMGPDAEIFGGPEVALLVGGTPQQVYERTRGILQSGIKEGGRFILREGNNLPPRCPEANLTAFYKAGLEFGTYGRA